MKPLSTLATVSASALALFLFATGCNSVYVSPIVPFNGLVQVPGTRTVLGARYVQPRGGLIYSSYRAPLTTKFEATPAKPPKVGKARTTYVMLPLIVVWLDFAFDDASVKKAAQNGGITRIHYADYEFTSVCVVFGSYETTVYGE
jgi:hypothetical protein